MVHAGRAVPRAADVELEVGVVGEQLALAVDGDIHGIAQAGGDHLPVLAVGRNPTDPTAGRLDAHGMALRVGHRRQQRVLQPDRRLHARHPGRHPRMVAGDQIQPLAVLGLDDAVRGVFIAHLQRLDERELVIGVVAIGVAYPIEALHRRHVEAVEGVEKTQGTTDGSFAPFDRDIGKALEALDADLRAGVAFLRQCDSEDAFVVLIRNDDPALGVKGQGHPRALLGGDRVEKFRVEALWQVDLRVRVEDVFAIVGSGLGDDGREE